MSDRILTVRQPWATEIIHGTKNVENRSWSTEYRGRLWIHAGARLDRDAVLPLERTGTPIIDLPMGVIIGHVELVDIVRDSDSVWAQPGQFHWVFRNPVACDPIPWRGQLALGHFTPA